jgi:hypothetical protein
LLTKRSSQGCLLTKIASAKCDRQYPSILETTFE